MNIIAHPAWPHPVFDLLHAYQRPHVAELGACLDVNRCIINGSDPGTGKTYITCALAAWKGRPLLVCCPKPAVSIWFNVAALFGANILGVANYEALRSGKYFTSQDAFMGDNRVACPYFDGANWDLPNNILVVFDEAHKGKNGATGTSRLMLSIVSHIHAQGPRCILLSATITDSVAAFHTPAVMLGLAQAGKRAYQVWVKQLGVGAASAMHHAIYPRFGARIRIDVIKRDPVVDLFRNNDLQAQTYPMSADEERGIVAAYGDIDEAITALKAKQAAETHPLTAILRARQRIEMLKVPTMAMLAMEYLLGGHNVGIFVNFNDTCAQLFDILDEFVQAEFGSHIARVVGGQTGADRAREVEDFQAGRARVIICNIRAGGTCLSLHGENRVALISPAWSSIDLLQTVGRMYRAGGGDVIQRIIYCRGRASPAGDTNTNDTTFVSAGVRLGVEEIIARAVNTKLRTIEFINNATDDDLYQI